jgi:hypothetical protein
MYFDISIRNDSRETSTGWMPVIYEYNLEIHADATRIGAPTIDIIADVAIIMFVIILVKLI